MATDLEAVALWHEDEAAFASTKMREAFHTKAAAAIRAAMGLLVEEREDRLWNAYHTGYVKDGRWGHMFMSDGEWLAKECGFNPRDADYDNEAVKTAIPVSARRVLEPQS
jgi:hypothetical protein